MKFNNETLRAAVKEWLDDAAAAEATYGHISSWDTSEVTDMSKLFENAKSFNQPIGDWDVSNVTNMYRMFSYAHEFNQPLDNWNVSKVENMSSMFGFAKAFNQNIDNWNISKVNNLDSIFFEASSFDKPLNKWDMSNASNIRCMFFKATSFNQPIGNWNVGNVTNMSSMFANTDAFNQPIGNWDLNKVTNMEEMFSCAEAFSFDFKLVNKTLYYNGNIKTEYEVNPQNIKNGYFKEFHNNGQLKSEVNFTNGIQVDGEVISYHSNGNIASKIMYTQNENDQFSEWFENGSIKNKGYYEDGVRHVEKVFDNKGDYISEDKLYQKFYEKLKKCTPNFMVGGVTKKLDSVSIKKNLGEVLLMSQINQDTIEKLYKDNSLRICCVTSCTVIAYVVPDYNIENELAIDEIRNYLTEDVTLGQLYSEDTGDEVLFGRELEKDDVYNLSRRILVITLYQDVTDWFIDIIKAITEIDPEILEEFSNDSSPICPNEIVEQYNFIKDEPAYIIDYGGIQDERSTNIGYTISNDDIAITTYYAMNDDDWFRGNELRFFRKV